MEQGQGDIRQFLSSKVEAASPGTDWKKTWRLARLKGLGPEHTSFLFKLLQKILPTQERLHRTNNDVNPQCKATGCMEIDDLDHNLVLCPANENVGRNLLELLRQHQPTLTTPSLLRLELEVDEELELPLVWITAATLLSIWEQRKVSTRVQPHLTRSQLEAKVNILRETRLSNLAAVLKDLINNMFEQ